MSEEKKLPEHWQTKKLGEVFTIERGGSPRPIEEFITEDENGINWIKIGDTKDVVKYIHRTKEKIKPEGAKRSRMVYEDDFLLSNSMSFGRPYIMKTTGCIHDGWLVIRKNETVDNNYLYYILSSPLLYQQFTNLAKGSTVKNLNIEAVKQAVINFPPLSEQTAIVSKIEELLSDLENGKQQLLIAQQQLKTYRQSLLKWAFEGRLTNPPDGRAGKNVNGELPKGWTVLSLKDVCTKITDGSHFSPKSTPEGYPYVTVRDIKNDKIDFENCLKISASDFKNLAANDCRPLENDLLFSKDGTVGKVSLVDYDYDFVVLSSIGILRTNTKVVSPKYLFHVLKSSEFLHQALNQKKGVAIRRIILRDLKELKLNVPKTLKEQEQIVSELESKLTVCDKIEETITTSLQQAEMLKQSILKKAFEGGLV